MTGLIEHYVLRCYKNEDESKLNYERVGQGLNNKILHYSIQEVKQVNLKSTTKGLCKHFSSPLNVSHFIRVWKRGAIKSLFNYPL